MLRRTVPTLSTLLFGLLYEALLRYPSSVIYFWGGLILLIILSLLAISKMKPWSTRIIIAISAILFHTGAYYFIFFISGQAIKQTIIILALIINIIFLTHIYYYYYRTERYQVNALQNISSYMNLLSVFTLVSVCYGLILYLAWPGWLLSIFVFIIIALLTFQTSWASKVLFRRASRFGIICGLIGAEIFWAVYFLPSSFLVNAMILTVAYYVILNLGRYYLQDQLKKIVIMRYLFIGFAVLLLTVVSARWT
ncbi:hypothetical protein KKG41_04620 [Patescibacteria group bacterium]|nr:hypothetical protein [Patescibacteria group bacterium]MBU1890847.1 hypothetical protein [Patescibacteria group bacterium]